MRKSMSVDELALRLMEHYGVEITPQKLALNLIPVRAFIAELYNRGEIEAVVDGELKWRTKTG